MAGLQALCHLFPSPQLCFEVAGVAGVAEPLKIRVKKWREGLGKVEVAPLGAAETGKIASRSDGT
jgi:hypothetical protein